MKYTPVHAKESPKEKKPKTFGRWFGESLDNFIAVAFPGWGNRRRSARFKADLRDEIGEIAKRRLGVSWTRPDRARDGRWLTSGMAPNAVIESDIVEMQERCAEAYRTNNVAHAAVEARVSNEVGTGIKPQARIVDDRAANEALERNFAEWSKYGVDSSRKQSFAEFQRSVNRSMGIFGEAFILCSETPSDGPINLAVDVISPERVETPPGRYADPLVRMGVEYLPNGQIKGYWVRTTHPGEQGVYYEYKWDFYERFDPQGQPRMIHCFEQLFAGQVRGIPWMASSLPRMKDLDDWFEAELVAKQVEACFGLIFEGAPDGVSPLDVAASNADAVANGKQLEELEPGMIHYAANGESVKTVDPSRPGGTFAPFVERTNRSIAATLNLPYEILAKDYFRTTFSSGQLAMLDGRHGFKMRRQTMVDGCLIAIWCRFVNDVVFANEADGTIDITRYVADRTPYEMHIWVAPGWGFINPRDEIRALTEALDADMTNLSSIYAEKGEDMETQLEKRKTELMMLTEMDVEVRAYRMQLEEAAGLPPTEVEEQPDGEEQPSNQQTEDQTVQ